MEELRPIHLLPFLFTFSLVLLQVCLRTITKSSLQTDNKALLPIAIRRAHERRLQSFMTIIAAVTGNEEEYYVTARK